MNIDFQSAEATPSGALAAVMSPPSPAAVSALIPRPIPRHELQSEERDQVEQHKRSEYPAQHLKHLPLRVAELYRNPSENQLQRVIP